MPHSSRRPGPIAAQPAPARPVSPTRDDGASVCGVGGLTPPPPPPLSVGGSPTSPLPPYAPPLACDEIHVAMDCDAADDDPLLDTAGDTEWNTAPQPPKRSSFVPLLSVVILFACYAGAAALVYQTSPPIPADVRADLVLPRSASQLKRLAKAAHTVAGTHMGTVASAYALAYTGLQTFCIPGSLFMTVLGGALFPLPLAVLLVSLCSALGASTTYLLSSAFGAPAIARVPCLNKRVGAWASQLAEHRAHALSYIIFLRVAPVVPNFLINLASPHLHVALRTFALGTFVGVAPPAFVYARLGAAVQKLTDEDFSVLNPLNIAAVITFAVLAGMPIAVRWWRERRGRTEDERVDIEDGVERGEVVRSDSRSSFVSLAASLGERLETKPLLWRSASSGAGSGSDK